jgi:hypothetical protein
MALRGQARDPGCRGAEAALTPAGQHQGARFLATRGGRPHRRVSELVKEADQELRPVRERPELQDREAVVDVASRRRSAQAGPAR